MPEAAASRFKDIAVGQTASFRVDVTEEMVSRFAKLSGDHNPLHVNEIYAKETQFKGRVVHGMLVASFFSRLVGMYLPGRHALYVSQTLMFRKPCRIGTKLLVRGTVKRRTEATSTITIQTEALDAENEMCILDGEAVVKILQ